MPNTPNLSNLTQEHIVVEEVVSEVPEPTIPQQAPSPKPVVKRPRFKARDYDPLGNGGLTSESGRFKVR